MRAILALPLAVSFLAGSARAQTAFDAAPLDTGSPEAAFAGGPIRLTKASAAMLREHFKGDNVPLVPQPFRTRLDVALATRDWPRVEAAKRDLRTQRGVVAMLQWEQSRFIATGGIGVAEIHAVDMADMGSTGVSESAAMLWLYAVAVTMTDGHKCADEAAKDAHVAKLMGPAFDKVTQIVRTMPDDRLAAMRDLAIRLESVLSVDRTDDTMCRTGALKPELKPDQEWRPEAAATRGILPKELTVLCAVMRPKLAARMDPPKRESPPPEGRKPAVAGPGATGPRPAKLDGASRDPAAVEPPRSETGSASPPNAAMANPGTAPRQNHAPPIADPAGTGNSPTPPGQ